MGARKTIVLAVGLLAACRTNGSAPPADAGGPGTDARDAHPGLDVGRDTPDDRGMDATAARDMRSSSDAPVVQPTIGQSCSNYCENSPCGNPEPECDSGYCVWDDRYLGESYCSILCSGPGAACPGGYSCVHDGASSKDQSWCVKLPPVMPTDVGQPCTYPQNGGFCEGDEMMLMSFCLYRSGACMAALCVHDPVVTGAYCSMSCRVGHVDCPSGYDCRVNPLDDTSDLTRLCTLTHDPSAYVGLYCDASTTACTSDGACVTEAGLHTCAPDGGYCIRGGPGVSNYCTMRCETEACPTGYTCSTIVPDITGPPTGEYCVKSS